MNTITKAMMTIAVVAVMAAAFVSVSMDESDAAEVQVTVTPTEHPTNGLYLVVNDLGSYVGQTADWTVYQDGASVASGSTAVTGQGVIRCGPVELADGKYTLSADIGTDTLVGSFSYGNVPGETYTVTVDATNADVDLTDAEGNPFDLATELEAETTLTVSVTPTIEGDVTVTVNGQTVNADETGAYVTQVTVDAQSSTITVVATAAQTGGDDPVLTGIAVTTNPDKMTYTAEEAFDATGMVVTATYSDETTEEVTGYEVSYDFAVSGEVTVSYQGQTAVLTVTVQSGSVNPPAGESWIISEDTTIQVPMEYTGTLTVNPGVTVTLEGDEGALKVNGDMYLYGSIVAGVDTTNYVEIPEGSYFKAFAAASVQQNVIIQGAGTIDLADAMSTMTISQDVRSSNAYSQTQIVVIEQSLNLKSGTYTTILGELQVNEGVTLTVESGAYLIVDSQTARMIVDGTVEVEEGAYVYVIDADEVVVNGAVVSDGVLAVGSNVIVNEGGSIVVEDGDESVIFVSEGLTIEAGASLTVRGDFAIEQIENKGTITLNGAVMMDDSYIFQAADGAVVDIRSFTSDEDVPYTLYVTDYGLVFREYRQDGQTVTDAVGAGAYEGADNVVAFEPVAGVGIRNVTVTESVTYVTENRQPVYTNHMVLSGSASIADETEAGYEGTYAIAVGAGSCVDVDDSFTVGRDVELRVAYGEMNVAGTLTAVADGSSVVTYEGGEITVTGMIETAEKIDGTVNGFHYEAEVESETRYYYTTLAAAVANGATAITAMGEAAVAEDVTISAGTQLNSESGAIITIGSADDRSVTVTVADGATVRSCEIYVEGTLYFENSRNNRSNTIHSDVSVAEGDAARYTNIYTALANAEAGDVVTLNRTAGEAVVLDADVTVNDGVILDVPASQTLTVNDGVTMTVNGTVRVSGTLDSESEDGFNPVDATGAEKEEYSVIAVNGALMRMTEIRYTDYYVAGAYYNLVNSDGNWYYVTPVAQAAAVSDDVTDGYIDIYGQNTIADVAFTGDERVPVTVTVKEGATLIASSVTLSQAMLDVDGAFNGAVSAGAGSVEIVNATAFQVEAYVENDEDRMALTGTIAQADAEGDDAEAAVASGTVTVPAGENLNVSGVDFEIAEGAALVVSGAGAQLSASALTVAGSLTAYNGGNVSVTTLTVGGDFTVAPADREEGTVAGSANVETLYVGITSRFAQGTEASVSADAIRGLQTMYVSAASSVTEDLAEGMTYSTGFYIEDQLWMTGYANGNISLGEINPVRALTNSVFVDWQYMSNGTIRDVAEDARIGTYEEVYALLEYDIYVITVFADPGIEAVYIDGVLMTSGYFVNDINGVMAQGFRAVVSAGSHEITYKTGTYYSGSAQMTVNGDAVSGNTFTASGNPESGNTVYYVVFLQGIEAETPSTPVQPSGETSDDGMSLTDILLIILVVLIVIMVIIVALRLMRS